MISPMISRGYAGLFGGSTVAAFTDMEHRDAHVMIDVDLAALAGGHTMVVAVADA